MTWEQKLAAIEALDAGAHVEMRAPGDWYVQASMEKREGTAILIGKYGNGESPEAAVEDHWRHYGDGSPLHYRDKWYRWNGFMWSETTAP